jgi:hypothetical protein
MFYHHIYTSPLTSYIFFIISHQVPSHFILYVTITNAAADAADAIAILLHIDEHFCASSLSCCVCVCINGNKSTHERE